MEDMEENLFCEMMAHIFTIEGILMTKHNISYKTINKLLDLNRKDIVEQINNYKRRKK